MRISETLFFYNIYIKLSHTHGVYPFKRIKNHKKTKHNPHQILGEAHNWLRSNHPQQSAKGANEEA